MSGQAETPPAVARLAAQKKREEEARAPWPWNPLDLDLDETLSPSETLELLTGGPGRAKLAHRLCQEGTLDAHREVVALMGDVLAATERAVVDAGGVAFALHAAIDLLRDVLDWHLGDVEAALKERE